MVSITLSPFIAKKDKEQEIKTTLKEIKEKMLHNKK